MQPLGTNLSKISSVSNSIASTVYNFMATLSKEQGFFKLSTIVSLISETNCLEAKNIILDLIKAQIIVPAHPDD